MSWAEQCRVWRMQVNIYWKYVTQSTSFYYTFKLTYKEAIRDLKQNINHVALTARILKILISEEIWFSYSSCKANNIHSISNLIHLPFNKQYTFFINGNWHFKRALCRQPQIFQISIFYRYFQFACTIENVVSIIISLSFLNAILELKISSNLKMLLRSIDTAPPLSARFETYHKSMHNLLFDCMN